MACHCAHALRHSPLAHALAAVKSMRSRSVAWRIKACALDNAKRASFIKDGSVIRIGNVRLDVVHTPGHTPEHLSYVVTDRGLEPLSAGLEMEVADVERAMRGG